MSNYLPAFLLPITVTSANYSLRFTANSTAYTVTITAAEYADMIALLTALQVVMRWAVGGGTTITLTISTVGKVVFTYTGAGNFQLNWTHAGATIEAKLGFNGTADDTGATTYTADYLMPHAFVPEFPLEDDGWERVDRSDDPGPIITPAGYAKRVTNPNDLVERVLTINHVVASRFHPDGGSTGDENTFCEWWAQATQGDAVRFYPHTDTWAGVKTYTLTAPVDSIRDIRRLDAGATYYGPITLTFKERTV